MEVLWSDDLGATWVSGVRLEPVGAVTNAYGVIVQSLAGRVYVVYNRNSDNVTTLPNSTTPIRNDELGHFVMRWSDDGGESWSPGFLEVPFRPTWIDGNNTFRGAVKMMWSVDQVKVAGGRTYHAFTKIGTFDQAAPEESFFLSSPNLLTAADAAEVTWDLLPAGEQGVRAPSRGMQWEEAHVAPLPSGSGFFSVCRTNTGYLSAASTADPTAAAGWSAPGGFASYWAALPAAAGRLLKNPEGPITLKSFPSRGNRFLLLFYFNSLPGYRNVTEARPCRNPVWVASGAEEAGEVRFSQPEVAVYGLQLYGQAAWLDQGFGYPDMIEDGGRIFITETNKTHARVHALDDGMLTLLLSQDTLAAVPTGRIAYAWGPGSQGASFATPPLPNPSAYSGPGDGSTLALWLTAHAASDPAANSTLLDVGTLRLWVRAGSRAVQLDVRDGVGQSASLATDAECTARLLSAGPHLLAAVLDAGAHMLTLSVDGALCDGGAAAEFGWAWLPAAMGSLEEGAATAFVLGGPGYRGVVLGGWWWTRFLYTSEVVGAWRAGPGAAATM